MDDYREDQLTEKVHITKVLIFILMCLFDSVVICFYKLVLDASFWVGYVNCTIVSIALKLAKLLIKKAVIKKGRACAARKE